MSTTRFNELLPSKAVRCFIPQCLLIWCRDGLKGRGDRHKAQLQPREVDLLYAEGGRAALQNHWCSPSLWTGGRPGQGNNSSKFTAAHLQELYRQEDRKTIPEAYQTPAIQVISEQRHYLTLPIGSQPWFQHRDGPSPAANTCTADKHRPPSPTWHRLSKGKDTLCCVNMAVLLLEMALCLKTCPFAKGKWWCQAETLSRTWCYTSLTPHTEAVGERGTVVLAQTLLWSSPRCQLGLQYRTQQQSQRQRNMLAKDCETTATTNASTRFSPALSEGSVSSESSRSVFEHCLSSKHWGAQRKYPQLP